MCGIFGLIRNLDATHPERATAAFVELGMKAVERGLDSAGFALVSSGPNNAAGPAQPAMLRATDVTVDNVRIIKDTVSFTRFWDDSYLPLVNAHRVVLGHTRWATQGDRDAMINASPLITGALVGTHNGDVDTASVEGRSFLPLPVGRTDTEVLYGALNRDRRDRRKVTNTLRAVKGRAALAWVDRNRTDRVYLARAALSPLALAWDREGNLYYASNPRWFRDVDAHFNYTLGFHDIHIVREGTLLTIGLDGNAPDVEDMRDFIPQCRASDARLSDGIVWRGFDPEDCATDKAQQRHTVAAPAYNGYSRHGKGSFWPAKPASSHKGSSTVNKDTSTHNVPAYHDTLDGVQRPLALPAGSDTSTSGTRQATDWSAFDAIDDGWSPAQEDVDDAWAEDEAIEAADLWFADGADDTTKTLIRDASMPSEIKSLMDEFDLSTEAAFRKFQNLVNNWETAPANG